MKTKLLTFATLAALSLTSANTKASDRASGGSPDLETQQETVELKKTQMIDYLKRDLRSSFPTHVYNAVVAARKDKYSLQTPQSQQLLVKISSKREFWIAVLGEEATDKKFKSLVGSNPTVTPYEFNPEKCQTIPEQNGDVFPTCFTPGRNVNFDFPVIIKAVQEKDFRAVPFDTAALLAHIIHEGGHASGIKSGTSEHDGLVQLTAEMQNYIRSSGNIDNNWLQNCLARYFIFLNHDISSTRTTVTTIPVKTAEPILRRVLEKARVELISKHKCENLILDLTSSPTQAVDVKFLIGKVNVDATLWTLQVSGKCHGLYNSPHFYISSSDDETGLFSLRFKGDYGYDLDVQESN